MHTITEQFALDIGCSIADLTTDVFCYGQPTKEMFSYHRFAGVALIYQGKLYVRANSAPLLAQLKKQYQGKNNQWFFELQNIQTFQAILAENGYSLNEWGTFLLPQKIVNKEDEAIKIFYEEDIKQFKNQKNFDQCFADSDEDPDKIGVAYQMNGKIIGMAGCNENGKYCYEIGMNILPHYRKQGLATKLIQKLTAEIRHGTNNTKIPVARTEFSHTDSINAFLNAGYKMGWTAISFVKKYDD